MLTTRTPIYLALCASVVSMLPGLAGCSRQDAKASVASAPKPAVKVNTTPVVKRPMPQVLLLTGNLTAFRQADIAANASGKVVATYVERGASIKQGEILARLDAGSASLMAVAASAQSDLAKNQMELAKRECARAQALFDKGTVTQAEYDRMMSQCTNSQYAAAAAAANQLVAAKTVGDSSIRAPFAGVIGERYANVGEFLQPMSKVVSIYAMDPLRLELTVPESSLAAVHVNTSVRFTVTAYGTESFTGTVKFISPNVRKQSRDVVVEALVNNPDGKLRPGMFAAAKVLLEEKPTLVVPASALRTTETSSRVFVVSKGEAEERVVQVGESKGVEVGIVTGLTEGETVVTSPPAELRDGSRLE